jgi:cytoskeletal protein RodZ
MKLEGEIGEINVIERLVELGREGFTGAVRFENDGIIKIIYFKNGDVLSASTNDRSDSVDEILLRANKVTREHVKQALSRRKENETLGDALLGLGFITRKELSWARRVQVIGAVRSIAAWGAGTYNIVADYLPKREEGTLFPLQQLIAELIVTDNDRAKVERALDGGNAVFARGADFDEQFSKLSLNEEAEQIVTFVDGSRNSAEIAVAAGKDAFNVYKLLLALATIGVLTRKAQGTLEEDFASVGVADASDQWASPPEPEPPMSAWDAEEEPVKPMSWDSDEAAIVPEQDAPELVHSEEPPTLEVPLVTEAPPPILMPSPLPPPTLARTEPQWGFDEAQIETARRAAVPVSSKSESKAPPMKDAVKKAAKPDRWMAILIFAVVIVGLGLAAPYAWTWWQARNAPPVPVVVAHKPRPRRGPGVMPPPSPAEIVATTTTSTTGTTAAMTGTTGTTGTMATTTVATATVAPATTTTTKPPAVVAIKPAKPATTTAPPPSTAVTIKPAKPAPSQATVITPNTNTTRIERNATGAATMTNSGGALPKVQAKNDDAMRSHYEEMAQSFASQATGSYTVQFELVCQTSSLTKAVQAGGSNVWFVPIAYKGQGCYRVFWGHFASKAEAERGMTEVPASLRAGSKPSVVSVPKK